MILNEIIIDQVHVSLIFAYLLVVSRPAVYFLMPKSIAIRCGVVENFNEMSETFYFYQNRKFQAKYSSIAAFYFAYTFKRLLPSGLYTGIGLNLIHNLSLISPFY